MLNPHSALLSTLCNSHAAGHRSWKSIEGERAVKVSGKEDIHGVNSVGLGKREEKTREGRGQEPFAVVKFTYEDS